MTTGPDGRNLGATLCAFYEQVPEPEPLVLTGIRRDVLTRIASRDTRSLKRWHPRRARLVAGVLGAVAAAGAIGGGVAALPGGPTLPDGGPVAPKDPAESVRAVGAMTLDRIAQRTAHARPLTVRDGQYVYTRRVGVLQRSVSVNGELVWYLSETVMERWSDPAAPVPVRIRVTARLNARPRNPADQAKLDASGEAWKTPSSVTFPDQLPPERAGPATPDRTPPTIPPTLGYPTLSYLSTLPTDPDRLADVLRTQSAHVLDHRGFHVVFGLVTWWDELIPPDLRAGLYRVLGRISGAEQVPGLVEFAGRTGIAVACTDHAFGMRYEIIIDPDTSRVIGTREVALRGHVAGDVLVEEATSDQKVVDALGDTE